MGRYERSDDPVRVVGCDVGACRTGGNVARSVVCVEVIGMPTKKELAIVFAAGIFVLVMSHLMNDINKQQVEEYQSKIQSLEMSLDKAMEALNMVDFEVHTWEATAYAPLDPQAVEGVCYAGDPNVTASGMPIEPGISVAAGPDIPFGTWLWIEGLGWRRVDDRGGAIRDGSIDICMITREEAIRFGRRKVTVIIPKWEEGE